MAEKVDSMHAPKGGQLRPNHPPLLLLIPLLKVGYQYLLMMSPSQTVASAEVPPYFVFLALFLGLVVKRTLAF